MTSPIAITGSTGAVGGRVARALSAEGHALRLLVRDASRAPDLPDSTVHVAPYADTAACTEALAGVETLFLVSAAESADRPAEHRSIVEAAASAGVQHVVYTSFLGAAPDAVFTLARDHAATEQHLRDSGMSWTFLRDAFYLDLVPHLVGDDGVIRGPAGDGRAAFVAQADVARSAAAVLRDPAAHSRATYELTGPEALTFAEAAEILTAARGTAVTFHDETIEEARASRARWEPEPFEMEAWVSTYTAIAAGEQDVVSQDVERLTGRRPVSLSDLLQ